MPLSTDSGFSGSDNDYHDAAFLHGFNMPSDGELDTSPPRRTHRGRKTKKFRSTLKSCDFSSCSSLNSSASHNSTKDMYTNGTRNKNVNVEYLVCRIYLYFKLLLISVHRQRCLCEKIGMLMHEADARWGYTNRKMRNDPTGCLAPIYFNGITCDCAAQNKCVCAQKSKLKRAAKFPAYWAVPQPAVFYKLLENDIKEYLRFLERINPESVGKLRNVRPDNIVGGVTSEEAMSCIQTLQSIHPNHFVPVYRQDSARFDQKPLLSDDKEKNTESSELYSKKKRQNHQNNGEEIFRKSVDSRNSIKREDDNEECDDVAASSVFGDDQEIEPSTTIKTNPPSVHWRNGIKPPPPPATILSPTGQYQISHMDVLSEKIWHYHNKVSQTEEMLARKLHLRDMLYSAISPVFPMCGLYVVGSSLNGFGNNSSDMDLCLMITNRELDQRTDAVVVLNLILTTLQYEKFVTSQKLILAKVPILRIKFADPFSDITVDLNANNSVAIKNTHLLCYYSSYDWRVRPLVSVVKEWAKRKGINDANKSSFTSYSLVLMVIHYLQCGTNPSILPNLQKIYPHRFSNKLDVRSLNITTCLDRPRSKPSDCDTEDTATLGQLLIGFLDYYANKFDYDRDAISIRQGQRIERAVVARPKIHANDSSPPSSSASSISINQNVSNSSYPATAWRSQWRCVCIEEPFTNSNTAHSIYDEMVFGAIKAAFREAHAELNLNHDLDRLLECSPINVPIPCSGAVVYAASYEGERPPMAGSNSITPVQSMNVKSNFSPNYQSNGSSTQQQNQKPQQQQQQKKEQQQHQQQAQSELNSPPNQTQNPNQQKQLIQSNGKNIRASCSNMNRLYSNNNNNINNCNSNNNNRRFSKGARLSRSSEQFNHSSRNCLSKENLELVENSSSQLNNGSRDIKKDGNERMERPTPSKSEDTMISSDVV